MNYVPVVFTSATTGYKVKELMDLVLEVFAERSFRFKTRELMDIIKALPAQHGTPGRGKKKLKLKFAVQADMYPPSFTLFVNDPNLVHFSYERYLENALRERHKFVGTPIRFLWRQNVGNKKMEASERKEYRKKNKQLPKPQSKQIPSVSQREAVELK